MRSVRQKSGVSERVRTKFTRKLLAWWARAARDLPWRKTRDPYRVLVSEFMLQQTQVSRVAEYYPRFLERFPDLETLARARPRAVREAWDGLGYYARARNLHSLAKQVAGRGEAGEGVAGNGVPTLPDDPEELIKLPGIGPYTAGAVASFARSEEHTSELQSRLHLVCRLLLEKKKKIESTANGIAR